MRIIKSSPQIFVIALGVSALLSSAGHVRAAALATVEVFPPEINLSTSRARQMFVVKATYADGITRDVTGEARAAFVNPALARLDKNVVYPLADGITQLKVDFGGQSIAIPVKI